MRIIAFRRSCSPFPSFCSIVSMPNKTVVGQYLDKLSPAAELAGTAGFKMWTGHDMPIEHMKEVLGIRCGE